MSDLTAALDRVCHSTMPRAEDLETLLEACSPQETGAIFAEADRVRQKYLGDGIFLRGIVEFSSFCQKDCHYCGLNRNNTRLTRYRMTAEEIMESVAHVYRCGIRTVVLQSGEWADLEAEWIESLVLQIKRRFAMAVTLSVGERSCDDYKLWRRAGADRYLLKIETSDPELYASLHGAASFENRLRCLGQLRDLGYEVGTGSLIGLKGQSALSIAKDILFFAREDFDMIGIGPFIPHPDTPLAAEPAGQALMTLKAIALTRIVTKNTNLPATTALGSLDKDHRPEGLRAGANVLMPNFTPFKYRKLYELYPGKRCVSEPAGSCAGCMQQMAGSVKRFINPTLGGRGQGEYAA